MKLTLKRLSNIIGFILWMLFTTPLSAQNNKEDYLGSWSVLSIDHRLDKKISIPTIGILQHYELFNHYEFAFFRTGISLHLNPKVTTTIGYGYLSSEPFSKNREAKGGTQHWMYEEVYLRSHLQKFAFDHRFRHETRWIRKDGERFHPYHRLRYRFQLKHPIRKNYYIRGFNELFINLQKSPFNQNRSYVGLGAYLNDDISLDIGYMRNAFSDANFDRIRICLSFRLDYRKNTAD
ncbi:DUF2490 domain-containing protein [Sungkyunkwania multivorans]|uniref:DUF2490 domain-containing protein n=1 Tax=Sungkyunkwania multivorans TaxID=1173618 RepID=A0ABW3CX10_9FLAO